MDLGLFLLAITPRVQIEWVALSETTSIHASTDFNTVGKVADTSFHNKHLIKKADLPSSNFVSSNILHVRVDRAGSLTFDSVKSL